MKTVIKMLAVAGMIGSFAVPVFAAAHMQDPMTMTCADFTAMEKDAMMTATAQMDMMMAMTPEEQTAAMAMTPEEKTAAMAEHQTKMDAMTDDEKAAAMTKTEGSMATMMSACKKMPAGTVMDAAKAAM